MINTNDPIFFDKHNKNIKKLLKKQGNITCRDKIHDKTLANSIRKFDYGFAIIKNKAFGENNLNINHKYSLVAYILFRIDYLNNTEYIFIDLVCSNKNHKNEHYGTQLLNLCCDYAKKNNISYIQLHSLNEIRLIEWYMKQGFNIVFPIKLNDEIKVYLMDKKI